MIKAVFIDIDNTLLSFSEYVKSAMRDGFSQLGIGVYTDESFATFNRINDGLWHRIEQGTLTLEELKKIRWNLIFAELGIDYDGVAFEKYFRDKLNFSAIPEKGAHEMLEYLSGKYVLCTASNGPYDQQINRLRVGGMLDRFEYNFISSKIGAQKPSREFFEAAFNELHAAHPDILPEETMIIGDSVSSDIAGGRAFGMKTCLYLKKDSGDADYIITDLSEIKNIL